jgi:hypothetical protein
MKKKLSIVGPAGAVLAGALQVVVAWPHAVLADAPNCAEYPSACSNYYHQWSAAARPSGVSAAAQSSGVAWVIVAAVIILIAALVVGAVLAVVAVRRGRSGRLSPPPPPFPLPSASPRQV